MANKLSRRQILTVASASVTALAVPSLVQAQPNSDKSMEPNQPPLAKPLSPEAQILYEEALKGVRSGAEDRLKIKLPENSEPCTTYSPAPREVRYL